VEAIRNGRTAELGLPSRESERLLRLPEGDVDESEIGGWGDVPVQLAGQVAVLGFEEVPCLLPTPNAYVVLTGRTSNALIKTTGSSFMSIASVFGVWR
jgi:hypothetical protein